MAASPSPASWASGSWWDDVAPMWGRSGVQKSFTDASQACGKGMRGGETHDLAHVGGLCGSWSVKRCEGRSNVVGDGWSSCGKAVGLWRSRSGGRLLIFGARNEKARIVHRCCQVEIRHRQSKQKRASLWCLVVPASSRLFTLCPIRWEGRGVARRARLVLCATRQF